VTVGIIDYGAGNIRSVVNALKGLDVRVHISSDPEVLSMTDKLILPGVGEARSAMEALYRTGLIPWLRSSVQPFLGICLGMQLLFDRSTERSTDCLGVLPGTIAIFNSGKVPHIGWNSVEHDSSDPLLSGIRSGAYFYFVHSYRASLGDFTLGRTSYVEEFSSVVRSGNRWGVQFHPEKSGDDGFRLIKNFVDLC